MFLSKRASWCCPACATAGAAQRWQPSRISPSTFGPTTREHVSLTHLTALRSLWLTAGGAEPHRIEVHNSLNTLKLCGNPRSFEHFTHLTGLTELAIDVAARLFPPPREVVRGLFTQNVPSLTRLSVGK